MPFLPYSACKAARPARFPFKILVGTSAGALNATFLASRASEGLQAFGQLASFWATLRSSQVYRLKVPTWIRLSRIAAALFLSQQVRAQQSFLDNTPLVDTLHHAISLSHIDQALQEDSLRAGCHSLQLQQRGALDVLPDGRRQAGRFVEPPGPAG
ncbi:hypothetical protein LP414_13635 [Polaromonas sp. P1(28)-13]|nr:hypothetical protein LP414_13635 [Polaromonas sp. P1(28)-13]